MSLRVLGRVCVVVPEPALWLCPHMRGEARVVVVAGVVVLRRSSSWLLFAADLPGVTDVGLQAFSGAVASSPTLTTVTIQSACVGLGGSRVMLRCPRSALACVRGCPGDRPVAASVHAWRGQGGGRGGCAGVGCCATAHRG